MKPLKFKVLSPEHSAAIQTRLFELGCGWPLLGKEITHVKHKYLFISKNGMIGYDDDVNYYTSDYRDEAVLDDLYKEAQVVVSLNGNKKYDALIKRDGVYVDGCKFTHAIAIKLADTTKSKHYHVPFKFNVKDATHSKAIQKRLFDLGFKRPDGWTDIQHTKNKTLMVEENIIYTERCDHAYFGDFKLITLDDLFGSGVPQIHSNTNLILNSNYTAVIDNEKVVVGCQTFPRENIIKLGEEIKKFKEENKK
jgi:Fe2+ transport system protein FeoA